MVQLEMFSARGKFLRYPTYRNDELLFYSEYETSHLHHVPTTPHSAPAAACPAQS